MSLDESQMSVAGKEGGGNIRPQYRDIKLTEMMRYYTPKWMAWAGLAASVASAFQLPMFGYILSQYVFVLALPRDNAH